MSAAHVEDAFPAGGPQIPDKPSGFQHIQENALRSAKARVSSFFCINPHGQTPARMDMQPSMSFSTMPSAIFKPVVFAPVEKQEKDKETIDVEHVAPGADVQTTIEVPIEEAHPKVIKLSSSMGLSDDISQIYKQELVLSLHWIFT